ncbi:MAG: hypothetical protein NTY27_02910, partial [Actinobacteria bacterium]|nr:hypothetical protein [Actinomycetota bacterium]
NYTDYDAYGNAITQSGGSINPGGMANGGVTTDISTSFAFGAGYWDSSNLTYLVHRYLDNETGQFISVDPLVDQTREAYVYAGDGPVMAFDQTGLSTCLLDRPETYPACLLDAKQARQVVTEVTTGFSMGGIGVFAIFVIANIVVQLTTQQPAGSRVEIQILFGQNSVSETFSKAGAKNNEPLKIDAPWADFPIRVFFSVYHGHFCAVAINNRTLANASLNHIRHPKVILQTPSEFERGRLGQTPALSQPDGLPSKFVPVTKVKSSSTPLYKYGNLGVVTSTASMSTYV